MGLLQQFQQHWKQHYSQLSATNCQLLLAVSGGVDSMVLTDILYQCGFDFLMAHCNFQLRGDESERDEQFVHSVADKYRKQVFIKRFDTKGYAEEHKVSIQVAARELRYDWLKQMVNSKIISANNHFSSAKFIVTAHHANDNIETLLINFFRGTGIAGLHGIAPQQDQLIRPLLFAKKEEILRYAKENQVSWVDDSSNESDHYTRNFFRLNLVPQLKEVFPSVEDNLLQNIHRFTEAEILYQQALSIHKKKLITSKGAEIHIPVLLLKKIHPLQTVVWEIIKDFGFAPAQTGEVLKLADAENGSYIQSPSHRIIRNRQWLIITPVKQYQSQHILVESADKKIPFDNGMLLVEELLQAHVNIPSDNKTAMLDASGISFPLLLRKWKQGDYFYPLGMRKRKKLGRFFIDQKLSKTEKENVWVLEMNKKIIWVVGYRIDDRFKIIPSTKKILKFSYLK